jgi:hypothetical protein
VNLFQLGDMAVLVTRRKHVSLCPNHHRVCHFIEILISTFLVILVDLYRLRVCSASCLRQPGFDAEAVLALSPYCRTSVCLSVCPSVCASVRPSVHPSICIYLSIYRGGGAKVGIQFLV